MKLKSVINKHCICLFDTINKKEILLELIDLITAQGAVENKEILAEKIFYREELMSTGIGLGLAIPHVRYEGVKEPIVAAGIIRAGVPDYQSIDNSLVKIVIMILVKETQHKDHLQLLSEIVTKLKEGNGFNKLLALTEIDDIYNFLTN